MKTSLLLSSLSGDLTEREFRVLAAIYSAVGDKAYCWVAESVIALRAAGCRTAAVMASLGREASQLTRKQVRNVVSTLETKRFFARATVCNRQTYYSHRLTEEKLRAELVKRFASRKLIVPASA